jgi:glycosyltransferase involved in cell wall biosynthesis
MRILFISPYPTGEAPSQRFRFEQYFQTLSDNGHTYKSSPFLSREAWSIVYKKGHFFQKVIALMRGYWQRVMDVFSLRKFDAVFIHREASPFGPPWFEWIVAKVLKKYMIFDFDDAIWIPNASETNKYLTMLFKRFANVADVCRWSTVVSVGNAYLAEYARQFNQNVVINPTTIDTDEHHNLEKVHGKHVFTIGWTGSHSTVQYLDEIFPVLKKLEQEHEFEFHVICDVPAKFQLKSMKFVKWTKQREIDDLMQFNVGLMPLPEDIWAKGKCGFKALQYMSLGIPALVSNVGVNAEIVDQGVNGFVCTTPDEWYNALKSLLTDQSLLDRLSKRTREKIIDHYSVRSNRRNFLDLFNRKKQPTYAYGNNRNVA